MSLGLAIVGWAQIQKVVLNHRSHSSWAGVHPPEHFEPKQRSVAASATQRTASKVLASQYWRPIFRGRNFGLKLKFYYANRPLGTRKWHQNWNWWPNKKFLLVKFHDFFSASRNQPTSLIIFFLFGFYTYYGSCHKVFSFHSFRKCNRFSNCMSNSVLI